MRRADRRWDSARADRFDEAVVERLRMLLAHLDTTCDCVPRQFVDVPLMVEVVDVREVDGDLPIMARSCETVAPEIDGRRDRSLWYPSAKFLRG